MIKGQNLVVIAIVFTHEMNAGEITHRDSMGNVEVIQGGDIQCWFYDLIGLQSWLREVI
jgi:hypothetical protein